MIEAVESNDESCWSRELEVSELERELLEQGWKVTGRLYEGIGAENG